MFNIPIKCACGSEYFCENKHGKLHCARCNRPHPDAVALTESKVKPLYYDRRRLLTAEDAGL